MKLFFKQINKITQCKKFSDAQVKSWPKHSECTIKYYLHLSMIRYIQYFRDVKNYI